MKFLRFLLLTTFLSGVLAPLARADAGDELMAILGGTDTNPAQQIADATKAIQAGGERDAMMVAYKNRADAFRQIEQWQQAADDYGKVIELAKQPPQRGVGLEAYYRGEVELKLDQPDAALEAFDLALKSQNDWSDAFLGRARAKFLCGDLDGANADIRQAQAVFKPGALNKVFAAPVFDRELGAANGAVYRNPNDAAQRRARGVLRLKAASAANGDRHGLEAALRDFERAAELDPQSAPAFFDVGVAEIALDSLPLQATPRFPREVVFQNLDKALTLDAKYSPALAAKALYLLSSQAKADSEIDPDLFADPEKLQEQAKANQQARAQTSAQIAAAIAQGAMLEPQDALWPALLAIIERTQDKPDTAKLLELYTRAIGLTASPLPPELGYLWPGLLPSGNFRAAMFAERGHVYAASGDYEHALGDLQTSLQLENAVAPRLLRAQIYVEQKNWDSVIEELNEVLQDGATPAPSTSERAQMLMLRATAYDQKSQFDKAQADVDAALKIAPLYNRQIKGTRYDRSTQAQP
jgi:tetratricopeptide (TPR) repeat protein